MSNKPTYEELQQKVAALNKEISRRKEAEESLEISEAEYRGIIDRSFDGILTVDLQGGLAYISPSVERITGYKIDEVLNVHYLDFFPETELQKITQLFFEVSQGRPVMGVELRAIHRDGSILDIECNGVSIFLDGELAGAQVVFRDITGRKKMEKELQEKEHRYRLLAEKQRDVVLSIAIDGTVIYCSPVKKKFGGYRVEDVLGNSFKTFFALDVDLARAWEKIAWIVTNKETVVDEFLYRPHTGKPFPVEVTANPVIIKDEIVAILCIIRDISEKKRLEKEIVEVSEREKQQFGLDLHDGLGQMLTGILFMCKRLEDDLLEKALPEAAGATKIIDYLSESLSQVHDISKGLYPVTLDGEGFMDALEQLASDTENIYNVQCHVSCNTPVLIYSHMKAIHLYRVVQEAINNSVRHGQANKITINLDDAEDKITITVEDDGIGGVARNKDYQGLGLKIMFYRAGMIGASLDIQSKEDQGTVVVCSFRNDKQQEVADGGVKERELHVYI